MNCKFLELDSDTLKLCPDMDLTKIDYLFLSVDLLNTSHYVIDRNMLEKLNKLDRSKIIIWAYPQHNSLTKKDLDKYYIAIEEWDVHIVLLHSNFIINNYNCIYTDDFKIVKELFLKDKVTVVLCGYDVSKLMFKESVKPESWKDILKAFWSPLDQPQLDSFVDILVARPLNSIRVLKFKYGIQKIVYYKNAELGQYFRLDGRHVTVQI